MHNAKCTCWNCPAASLTGETTECRRRPEIGTYDPASITFERCPQWTETEYGYMLNDMRVMILGIDGYLGWTLALWLGKICCKVSGVDNYNRRDWVKERGSHSVVPIARMTDRLHAAKDILGIDINFREVDILKERERLKEFIEEVKPEAIVHYGECPSAPFSMIDVDHAIDVQKNNVLGTLGLLFIMRDLVPHTSLLKLGTMGEYGTPVSGRPLFEGVFPSDAILKWNNCEWSLEGELTPRDPGSFYHISKAQDTSNIYGACKYWRLRSCDVMQGVIFGTHTGQVSADPRLRTRLDIDEWFGSVVNRFVAQSVIGIPLTLYGLGEQTRGFIALQDAMECMTRLIIHPPQPRQYTVVNQLSGTYSLRQLAYEVAKVGKKHFNLPIEIQRVENPRVELDKHPYEVVYEELPKKYGFKTKVKIEEEIYRMFELMLKPEIRKRIEEKRHLILPRTWWSGVKKEVKRIELIDLEREVKKDIDRVKVYNA